MTEPVYIVVGVPRSGTSMLMRCLEAGGLPCVYDPAEDAQRNRDSAIPGYAPNPHGFYEVSNLHALDWPLARGRAVKVLNANIRCLPRSERYRACYLRRDPVELHRSFVSVAGPPPGPPPFAGDFEAMVTADLAALADLGADTVVINYASVIADPERELARLNWPIDVVRAATVVDASLYRHRGAV